MITDMMQEINLYFCEEKRNLVFSLIGFQNKPSPHTFFFIYLLHVKKLAQVIGTSRIICIIAYAATRRMNFYTSLSR